MIELDVIKALASDQTTNVLLIVWLVFNQRALRKIVDRLDQRLAAVENSGQDNAQRLVALETMRKMEQWQE